MLKAPPPDELDAPEYSGMSAKIEVSSGETAEYWTVSTCVEVLRFGREATTRSGAPVGDTVSLASMARHALLNSLKIIDVPAPNFSGTD